MEETQTGQVSRQVVQLGERKLELTLLEGDILHITYPECLQPKLIAVPAPVTKVRDLVILLDQTEENNTKYKHKLLVEYLLS